MLTTIVGVFLLFGSFQYFNTGSIKDLEKKDNFEVIAHRGVHQDFNKENLDYLNGCTAKRIYKPTHNYIENTIESIEAAFDYGATVVEIDIRPTKDKKLVVFHDWMLGCRTEVNGKVSDFLLKDLKKLDVGYGYTYDGGKTYPFRGKGVGKIKTLFEILTHFPDKKFLIDNKSGNNLEVAKLISDVLLKLPKEQRKKMYIWSENKSYNFIKQKNPSITRLFVPKQYQKSFYKSYILGFGLLNFDKKFQNEGIALPIEYTKFIWGWPYKFLDKVYDNDTRFYIYLNKKEEFKTIKNIPIDGVITDYIEIVGKELKSLKN